MNAHIDAGGAGMESTETLLRERCAADIGRASPDVTAMVSGGVENGRRLRRRRQRTTGAVAAVALIAASAIGYAALDRGWFAGESTGPTAPVGDQLVPATERGMAAAVLERLPDDFESVGAGGSANAAEGPDLAVVIAVVQPVRAEIQVLASSDVGGWSKIADQRCKDGFVCESLTTPEGFEAETVAGVDGKFTFVGAAVKRTEDMVIVWLTAMDVTGTLELTADDLVAIASDPTVGTQTTAELNAQGTRLENWRDDYFVGSDTGSSVSTSGTASPVEPTDVQPSGGGDTGTEGQGSGTEGGRVVASSAGPGE